MNRHPNCGPATVKPEGNVAYPSRGILKRKSQLTGAVTNVRIGRVGLPSVEGSPQTCSGRRHMILTATRAPLVVLLFTVSAATMLVAKDRIFVDQWSPTRSELFIADADGSNARKLVAGLEIDYNASFPSTANGWCLHPSVTVQRISFACGPMVWGSSDLPTARPSTIRPRSLRTAVQLRLRRPETPDRPTFIS